MKATRLAVILTVGFAVGGICYLAVRHYESAATIRGYSFEPPNPCRPKWLAGATTNALPSDDSMQQKLEGTWWFCRDIYYVDGRLDWLLSRLTLASNGGYVCKVTSGLYGTNRTSVIQGYWEVKNGLLLDTITNYIFRTTNEPVHHVFSNQVLRLTERELVYRPRPDGYPVLFRRVKQLNK